MIPSLRHGALTLAFAFLPVLFPASGPAKAAGFDPAPLARAVEDISSRLPARVGVAVIDMETGTRWAHKGDERFPTNSTFKVFLCAALLDAGVRGTADPDSRVTIRRGDIVSYSPVTEKRIDGAPVTLRELCGITVTISDNAAANLVMKEIGGPQALTAYLRGIGDSVTRADRWEPDSNSGIPGDDRDTTSPNAAAETLKKLVLEEALPADARQTLTNWLTGNKVGDATLRAGLPDNWRIADKTGAGANGSRNNIAVIWPDGRAPVVIAVYITETSASFEARNGAIAEIGAALADGLID
ncbi:class A beta-lactamase [Roseibium marinum]|uniref:beta-lactamase n=1 Tax=Roseibium marinum TaxID=281252 RepID=A0A2S3UX95_9HYPH|nr:class A beta-lactamase [Roseibium marinum]POF32306.1 beta-lactamase class A/beta-lactamase class A CARB-5 [Roseibium marinum]